jgi:hypothetical protein
MHENNFIGCKQPFDLRKEVDPQWIDRADNAEWQLAALPELFEGEAAPRLNLANLPAVCTRSPASNPFRSTESARARNEKPRENRRLPLFC